MEPIAKKNLEHFRYNLSGIESVIQEASKFTDSPFDQTKFDFMRWKASLIVMDQFLFQHLFSLQKPQSQEEEEEEEPNQTFKNQQYSEDEQKKADELVQKTVVYVGKLKEMYSQLVFRQSFKSQQMVKDVYEMHMSILKKLYLVAKTENNFLTKAVLIEVLINIYNEKD